ncbi:hypothetical protein HYW35_03100 [Candidatus Saccharibacteria bacterium]|nr:hypothetical protein [Candidatus Saccharibacteria bacterium]
MPRKKITQGSSAKDAKAFIKHLNSDYPDYGFIAGKQDHWSPRNKTINFNQGQTLTNLQYAVLHELAHALLRHDNYQTDFELLKLESEAWQLAAQIGKNYNVSISQDHIQNCLDTYRDWLHRRSACPSCGMHVLQQSPKIYKCFNCQAQWHVSSGRFVRPYRKTINK